MKNQKILKLYIIAAICIGINLFLFIFDKNIVAKPIGMLAVIALFLICGLCFGSAYAIDNK